MKPIKFDEANKNLLKPQNMTDEECSSLWVFTDGQQCISCWKMSFKQRLSALIHGKVWLSVCSGQTQPPVWVDCAKTVFETPTNNPTPALKSRGFLCKNAKLMHLHTICNAYAKQLNYIILN